LPGGKGGTYPRWTSRDVEQFVCYIDALRGQREFEASIVTPSSASRLKSSQQQLFE
jgi:hypothetical protein